jgi:prepilin-type N-terminal cleavage/methylation domain-containing protein
MRHGRMEGTGRGVRRGRWRSRRSRRGFTLTELVLVVTIMALLCGLAAPSMAGMLARWRTQAALNLLTGDLYYARMLALKSGRSVTVRLVADPACSVEAGAAAAGRSWQVTVRSSPPRAVRLGSLGPGGAGACVQSNRSDSLVFDSRGLISPPGNRTVWARSGNARDSLSISVVGRVLRRF